jgi:hypothetical protein
MAYELEAVAFNAIGALLVELLVGDETLTVTAATPSETNVRRDSAAKRAFLMMPHRNGICRYCPLSLTTGD